MKYLGKEADQVFQAIEESDSIVIFGHKNPDGDCVGSTLGMKHALLHYYPGKKIYAVGTIPPYIRPVAENTDEVSDETIRNSLALMLDLSDIDRVEDQRILTAKRIACIDHHYPSSEVDFPVAREIDAPSATYVIAKLLLEKFGTIPMDAARYLYLGLVTDSGRFQFDSRPDTFLIASELVKTGFNPVDIYNKLYQQNSKDLKFRSFVYDHFRFDGKVTYCLVSRKDYEAIGLSQNDASGKVNLLSLLDGHPMWAFFVEQEDGIIRVELRSNSHYNVQKVAVKFNGGGHLAASGCRIPSLKDYQPVVDELNRCEEI